MRMCCCCSVSPDGIGPDDARGLRTGSVYGRGGSCSCCSREVVPQARWRKNGIPPPGDQLLIRGLMTDADFVDREC